MRDLELQLLPAAKEMITQRLSVGLCVGNGDIQTNMAGTVGGGVYSFDRIQAEVKKTVEQSILFIGWITSIWHKLADIGQIGGLIVLCMIVRSA